MQGVEGEGCGADADRALIRVFFQLPEGGFSCIFYNYFH